jgi:predicted amidohydrolase
MLQRIIKRAKALKVDPDQPLAAYRRYPGSKQPKWIVRSSVDRLLKMAATACYDLTQAELGQYSSHSLRVGASVILNAAGFSEMDIMSCLRWKSHAYKVYLRNINVLAAKHTQAMSEVDIDQWSIGS